MTERPCPTPTAGGSHEPRDLREVVRNALERVVVIREALEDGDSGLVDAAAYELELDLASALAETA